MNVYEPCRAMEPTHDFPCRCTKLAGHEGDHGHAWSTPAGTMIRTEWPDLDRGE